MIAARLVRLIQSQSDALTRGLLEKLLTCERTTDLRKVPVEELQQRAYTVYHDLNEWLVNKTESDIARTYTALGMRRAQQGVALSQLVCGILTVKEHLFEFLRREGLVDGPVELFQELELLQLVDQFFDRAVYYAARGYEQERAARAA
jgi:hypothetical protein